MAYNLQEDIKEKAFLVYFASDDSVHELAEMKETINNLSQQMDYLIDIIEKKE